MEQITQRIGEKEKKRAGVLSSLSLLTSV